LGGFLLSRGMQKELIQQYCFWMKYLFSLIIVASFDVVLYEKS
jgi:hypothetical protein